MPTQLLEDAYAVILPALNPGAHASMQLTDETRRFLDSGGLSLQLGETRDEYVGREMSGDRRGKETHETFIEFLSNAKKRSGGRLLAALDQELGGSCRLHDLVPPFPSRSEVASTSEKDVEAIAATVAKVAASIGVNCFLSPILDLVTGKNPWLDGRTYSSDPDVVGPRAAAFVRGVQSAGVAATAKHFPGFHDIELDPYSHEDARVTSSRGDFERGFKPYRAVIAANVELVMVGPAIVEAFDTERAAVRSPKVIDVLKKDLNFKGVVLADGLDHKATMRGDSIEQVCIDALNAGCDWLLIPELNNTLERVATALVEATKSGAVKPERLRQAAVKIRKLAEKYETRV